MNKIKLKKEHLLEVEELSKMRANLKNELASVQATEIELENSKDVARVNYNKVKAYEIELGTNKLEFSEKFNVVSNKKNLFKIDIPADSNVREVLNLINSKYDILSFKKDEASIEEIFIKSVKSE